jgi:hypothetical protein
MPRITGIIIVDVIKADRRSCFIALLPLSWRWVAVRDLSHYFRSINLKKQGRALFLISHETVCHLQEMPYEFLTKTGSAKSCRA